MPKPKFGSTMAAGGKNWKENREAAAGSGGLKWEPGEYEGTTTVKIGVHDKGPARGCDYVSFETTVTSEGEYQGETYTQTKTFYKVDPKKPGSQKQSDQTEKAVVKKCKSLFPDLADEIEACGTLGEFAELLESDIAGVPVNHAFEVVHTEIENEKTGKMEPINYIQIGDVYDDGEAEEEEEAPPAKAKRGSKAAKAEPEEEEEEESEDDSDEEEEEDEDEGYTPTKGDVVTFTFKRKPLQCEVTKVNKSAQTVDLKDADDNVHKGIAWDKVGPL